MNGMDVKRAYEHCEQMQRLADDACLGQWNAFVEKGKTKEIRRARLFQAPQHFQNQIRIHCETVFGLKAKAREEKL